MCLALGGDQGKKVRKAYSCSARVKDRAGVPRGGTGFRVCRGLWGPRGYLQEGTKPTALLPPSWADLCLGFSILEKTAQPTDIFLRLWIDHKR